MNNRTNSILTLDLSKNEKIRGQWLEQREKKKNIYEAISEYIDFLENSIKDENDSYKIHLIKKEIKKLKKEQEKYYVPSILSSATLKTTSIKYGKNLNVLTKKIKIKDK